MKKRFYFIGLFIMVGISFLKAEAERRKLPVFHFSDGMKLVPYTDQDDKNLEGIVNDPKVFPFIRHGKPWDKSLIQGRHEAYVKGNQSVEKGDCYKAETFTVCWILKDKNNQIMGRFGFQPEDSLTPIQTEIFGALKGDYQHQGYGTKVFKTLVNWFTKTFPNQPLRALAMPRNQASQNLLIKSGFKKILKDNQHPLTTTGFGKTYDVFEYEEK